MLEAWRVVTVKRQFLAQDWQKIYTMLQEEAWLRDRLDVPDIYADLYGLTRADWKGPPKGDIEPFKAVKADAEAVKQKFKTRTQAAYEHSGSEFETVVDGQAEEDAYMAAKGVAVPDDADGDGGELLAPGDGADRATDFNGELQEELHANDPVSI